MTPSLRFLEQQQAKGSGVQVSVRKFEHSGRDLRLFGVPEKARRKALKAAYKYFYAP